MFVYVAIDYRYVRIILVDSAEQIEAFTSNDERWIIVFQKWVGAMTFMWQLGPCRDEERMVGGAMQTM